MKKLIVIAALAVSSIACGPAPIASIESRGLAEASVECVGEPSLSDAECQSWARRVFNEGPDRATVTRLVLTSRIGNARCAADFYGDGGALLLTAAIVCPSK